MADEEPCTFCGFTSFHNEDGRTICDSCGRDQGRALVTAEDETDFARQGNVVKKKVQKEKVKISKVLRGAKAYQLFLQAWQFILWKQCHALVHLKGFPAELWTIVRDLWTLWLSRLEHRLHDSNTVREGSFESVIKNEMTASSGEDSDPPVDNYLESRRRTMTQSQDLYPKLIDTVALVYMGIIMLRRPLGQATLLRWLLQEDIPFIRAIRYVPEDMQDRLPGEYHRPLDTHTRLPEPEDLQKAIYHRVRWFNTSFGMVMPAINENLFLFNYIRQLALPLEVYTLTRRLNTITGYDFAYPDFTKPLDNIRRQATSYQESQLMSLVVVATKLLLPFDSADVKRYPKNPNDPTTLRMDWTAWLRAKDVFDMAANAGFDPEGLKPGTEIHVTDQSIANMTDHQLDQYMDWYQRTWIKDSGAAGPAQTHELGGIDKEILDMFPLANVNAQGKTREQNEQDQVSEEARLTQRIRQVQSSLRSRRAISEDEEFERSLNILRPGAMYPRFLSIDDVERGGFPGDSGNNVIKIFHEQAAQTACLSLKTLLSAVNSTEEKIERWLTARRREDFFTEENSEHDAADHGELQDQEGTKASRDLDVMPETSPPAQLAYELGSLELGQSQFTRNGDCDHDIEMLSE